jgi:hypothetical protein
VTEDKKPSQETPTGAKIPVPSKADVLRDLRKVAKVAENESDPSAGSAEQEQSE